MCSLLYSDRCNDRGISLVEVVIATFLLTVAVMAILTLQPSAWRTAGRSDFMGRAAEILHKEMETNEVYIMNSGNPVAAGTTTRTVYPSGLGAAATGDVPYTVTTTITAAGTNVWTVATGVSWSGHAAITARLTVTRQDRFTYP
jgi:Tfp pilus assembly protein PilV